MEELKTILAQTSYEYELLRHDEPIASVEQGIRVLGITAAQTAPILIVKSELGFVGLIVSGERGRIDFKVVEKLLNCGRVKLAGRHEVKELTGCEAGHVPMVGLSIPVVVDRSLLKQPIIYGGTGALNVTLRIDPRALGELNEVIGYLD